MANFDAPIPLSEIECVLAWVDTFKLSRPTKKINRDFSDAVLLAEILSTQYPKLVEMHNYPPRNSHALKLNNWMTLNRKVLKKLKLNLCNNTMEQLSNSAPGVIERVLYMVREKIKRDEELAKATRDAEQNMSSGGSYYEALADDVIKNATNYLHSVPISTALMKTCVVCFESTKKILSDETEFSCAEESLPQTVCHLRCDLRCPSCDVPLDSVLIVPVRTRVNGVVETIQQKVINYDSYNIVKEELKDTKESLEMLKQKVNHLESLLKLRDERIDELQKQLERKSSRKKEIEAFQNSLKVPMEVMPSEVLSVALSESVTPVLSKPSVKIDPEPKVCEPTIRFQLVEEPKFFETKSRTSVAKSDGSSKSGSKVRLSFAEENVNAVKSDIFEEAVESKPLIDVGEDEFKDSIEDLVTTIEDTIQNEINEICSNTPNTEEIKNVE